MSDLIAVLGTSQVQWIVILIAVDVVLGIIAALMKKDFKLGKVAGFMKRGVLAYVLGFAVLVLAVEGLPSLAIVATIAYWLILLALVGSILTNLAKMGLPIPSILKKD